MSLPFIIAAGVALAAAGYGVKKKLMQTFSVKRPMNILSISMKAMIC